MRWLLDINVLIALLQDQHVHFDRAHTWWRQKNAQGWASCPLTQNGFLRVVMQMRLQSSMAAADAFGLLTDFIDGTDHVFWPDDVSLLDERLIARFHILGPKQFTDIYLLALAIKHDGRLVTFDRSIPVAVVSGARPDHLVVL